MDCPQARNVNHCINGDSPRAAPFFTVIDTVPEIEKVNDSNTNKGTLQRARLFDLSEKRCARLLERRRFPPVNPLKSIVAKASHRPLLRSMPPPTLQLEVPLPSPHRPPWRRSLIATISSFMGHRPGRRLLTPPLPPPLPPPPHRPSQLPLPLRRLMPKSALILPLCMIVLFHLNTTISP